MPYQKDESVSYVLHVYSSFVPLISICILFFPYFVPFRFAFSFFIKSCLEFFFCIFCPILTFVLGIFWSFIIIHHFSLYLSCAIVLSLPYAFQPFFPFWFYLFSLESWFLFFNGLCHLTFYWYFVFGIFLFFFQITVKLHQSEYSSNLEKIQTNCGKSVYEGNALVNRTGKNLHYLRNINSLHLDSDTKWCGEFFVSST